MKFHSIMYAVAALRLASANELHRCGTDEPDANARRQLESAYAKGAGNIGRATDIVVDTYVHIITTTAKEGRYMPEQVQEQMNVMNDAYSVMGVTFNTISVNFTTNDDWAAAGMSSAAESEMKQALHQGSYADLNLYFLSDMPDGLLGFCYFPVGEPSKADRTVDGCMNLADSLPGGSANNYNLGMTAVHETGHWFGLYHVFQGSSCTGAGDSVADTPMQRSPTTGCPTSQDSCPNSPGLDSIHNFMDYSYDECLYDFTDGQIDRALSIYDQYRAGK